MAIVGDCDEACDDGTCHELVTKPSKEPSNTNGICFHKKENFKSSSALLGEQLLVSLSVRRSAIAEIRALVGANFQRWTQYRA